MAKTNSKTSTKPQATKYQAKSLKTRASQETSQATKPSQAQAKPQASQGKPSTKGKPQAQATKPSQAKPSTKGQASQIKPQVVKGKPSVDLKTQAQVVPVKPGLQGSVKHRATFQGQDLAMDLQAASQFGDSYILQTSQLDQATKAAISKALYALPAYKGLHWELANLQIIPEGGASTKPQASTKGKK